MHWQARKRVRVKQMNPPSPKLGTLPKMIGLCPFATRSFDALIAPENRETGGLTPPRSCVRINACPNPKNADPLRRTWQRPKRKYPSASFSQRTDICSASIIREKHCSPPSKKPSIIRSMPAKKGASCPKSGCGSCSSFGNKIPIGRLA